MMKDDPPSHSRTIFPIAGENVSAESRGVFTFLLPPSPSTFLPHVFLIRSLTIVHFLPLFHFQIIVEWGHTNSNN